MAIANGTYVIVSAKDTSMAIDVDGNLDIKGTNVQIWKRNGKSGQYVTVTGEDTRQVLRFPLTGKVLDVYDAKAKNGQNIIQWVGNNGNGQAWNIVATGGTITVGTKSYPTYYIKSALNNNFAVGLKGNATAQSTNVQLASFSSTNTAQRWAFVPVSLLPAGYYRFVSALDTRVCLSSTYGDDGEAVKAVGIDIENNRQVWRVRGGTSTTYIENYFDCYLNSSGKVDGSAANLRAKPIALYSSWLMVVTGSMKYNGATYPLVTLKNAAGNDEGSEICVDVGGDKDKLTSEAKMHNYHGRKGQKFIAIPTIPVGGIAAPSDLKMAYTKGGTAYRNIWGRGKVTAYPSWVSGSRTFQFRYRQRVRKATSGDTAFSSWSKWRYYGNDTSNDGWGNILKVTSTPTSMKDPSGNTRLYNIAHTYTLSPEGNDLVEYQYQVRAVSLSKGINSRRGYIASGTGRYVYRPECTVNKIAWSPNGLEIGYSSDQHRNNNDLVLYSATCVHDGKTHTIYDGGSAGYPINDIKWRGTATLPQSKVSYIPHVGDSVTIKFRFTNVDGAYLIAKQTATKTVTRDSDQTLPLTPDIALTDGEMLHVDTNVSDADKSWVWVDYYDDGASYYKYTDVDGEFDIPVLFNKRFRAYVVVEKDGKWNIADAYFPAIKNSSSYWFNFVNSSGEQDWVQLKFNDGTSPTIRRSISYDSDIQLTNGNTFEVVHFGYGRSESIDIGGVIPLTFRIDNSSVSKFEALGAAHYAWFRAPNVSSAYRVAITNVDFDLSNPAHTGVELSITRISNPADW